MKIINPIRKNPNGPQRKPTDPIHLYNSAFGIGDVISGLYCACGLADVSKVQIVYHVKHPAWISRISHPRLKIADIKGVLIDEFSRTLDETRPYYDINGGPIGYQNAINEGRTRSGRYCLNLQNELEIEPFDPVRPASINKTIFVPSVKKKIVIVAPFANVSDRQWNMTGFQAVVRTLATEGYYPVVIGTEAHRETAKNSFTYEGVRLLIGASPERVIDMILQSDLVIGNDSGIPHVAGMFDIPTIAIHAGSLPHRFLFSMSPSIESVVSDQDVPRGVSNPVILSMIPTVKVLDAVFNRLN